VGGVHGQLGFSTAIIGSRRAKPAFREDKGRDRVFIPNRLPSPITRARQGAIQFFSQYRLDEAAHALLVLAGLVENLSLEEILQYFMDEDKRCSVFSPTTKVGDDVLRAMLNAGPKYSTSAKLPAIEQLLPKTGDKPLAGSMMGVAGPNGAPVHLLIVGFDYDRNRTVFFRSAPANGPGWGEGQPANVSLAGAVHASTNAPVNYFDAPAAPTRGSGSVLGWRNHGVQ